MRLKLAVIGLSLSTIAALGCEAGEVVQGAEPEPATAAGDELEPGQDEALEPTGAAGEVADAKAICPEPVQVVGECDGGDQDVWARLENAEICCFYENPCQVPVRDWHTFSSEETCKERP